MDGDILYSAINPSGLLVSVLRLIVNIRGVVLELGFDLLVLGPVSTGLLGERRLGVAPGVFLELFIVSLIAFKDVVRFVIRVNRALSVDL